MRRLEPKFVPRIWGRTDLSPLFGHRQEATGEVWFEAAPNHPLLIKFLFTSDRLSVQVHPNDEAAARLENCRGKTEMWYVIAAEHGSQVALGLAEPCEREALRNALEGPQGGDVLAWEAAAPGDAFLIPAGTIHALGAGLTVCEIQQNSDVTYRLFDYGRGRELHLDKGIEVADPCRRGERSSLPIGTQYFLTEELHVESMEDVVLAPDSFLIVLRGTGTISEQPLSPGVVLHCQARKETRVIEADKPLHLLCVMTQ